VKKRFGTEGTKISLFRLMNVQQWIKPYNTLQVKNQ